MSIFEVCFSDGHTHAFPADADWCKCGQTLRVSRFGEKATAYPVDDQGNPADPQPGGLTQADTDRLRNDCGTDQLQALSYIRRIAHRDFTS